MEAEHGCPTAPVDGCGDQLSAALWKWVVNSSVPSEGACPWAQGFHVALHCGVPSVEVLVQCVTALAAHGMGSLLILLLSVLLPPC